MVNDDFEKPCFDCEFWREIGVDEGGYIPVMECVCEFGKCPFGVH